MLCLYVPPMELGHGALGINKNVRDADVFRKKLLSFCTWFVTLLLLVIILYNCNYYYLYYDITFCYHGVIIAIIYIVLVYIVFIFSNIINLNYIHKL